MATRRGPVRIALAALALLASVTVALQAPSPRSAADSNEAPDAPGIYRSITAGTSHTCVRLGTGQIKCWGNGDYGQTGYGGIIPSLSNLRGAAPGQMGADLETVNLGAGRTARELTAGFRHTCALLDDATVRCWGGNAAGQLGQGSASDHASPGDGLPPIALGTGRTATHIAAGTRHTCAILDNATLKCWGNSNRGQVGIGVSGSVGTSPSTMGDNLPAVDLGTGRTPVAVAGGDEHTCALLDDGSVKCWGNGANGRLGLGDTASRGDQPGEMGDALPRVDLGTGRTATAITAGLDFTCALLDDGSVKCWGNGAKGQLGLGDTASRGDNPAEMGDALPAVDLGTGRTATAITANSDGTHTCATLDDGSVKCWGYGAHGRLGLGDAASRGDGPSEMGDALPAVDLGTGRTATAVTAGGSFTCAALDDGTLKCWGEGSFLGLGTTTHRGDEPGEMGDALPAVEVTGSGIAGQVTHTGGVAQAGLVAVLDANDHSLVRGEATSNSMYALAVPPGDYLVYVIDTVGGFSSGLVGAPTAFTVTPGQTTTANAVLTPTTGAIAGTVSETGSGAPIAGASVLLLNGDFTSVRTIATTDANGHYSVAGLTPARYLVAFVDPTGAHGVRFHPAAMAAQDATPVVVTAAGTATADGSLPSQEPAGTTATVAGKVSISTGTTGLANVTAVAVRASDLSFVRATTTDSSGNYQLLVPPGGYKLAFISSSTRAAESFDDQPFTNLPSATTVTAPAVANAGLATTSGTLRVNLSEAGSDDLAGDWVMVLGPSGLARAVATSAGTSNGSTVSTDVTFSALAQGQYRVVMVEPNAGIVEYFQDAPAYDSASLVPVSAGTTTTIHAVLGP